MKRRARVKVSTALLKQRLMLPGKIISAQGAPLGEEWDYVEFKLAGDDLPEVPEGDVIPEIDLEVIVIEDWRKPGEIYETYWIKDGKRHRIK